MKQVRLTEAAMTACLVLLLAGCDSDSRRSEAGVVNFYNWADYIDEGVLTDFEAETGIKVNYDVYDANEVLEGKLLAGNTGYDLVVPTGNFFAGLLKAGVFKPLDKSSLPNLVNLDAEILRKIELVDPGNRYSIPYGWGTTGLGINLEDVSARLPGVPLDSFALLFDPKHASRLADCGIAVLDSPEDVSEAALIYLGYLPSSEDPGELEEAMGVVASIRPFIRYFNSSLLGDDFANGEVCLVYNWSGTVYQVIEKTLGSRDLSYVIPREGALIWFDHLAIPSDAPNSQNAHRLMDYLMRPEVAARITNVTHYPYGNEAALAMIEPAIRDNPTIYPPPEARARLHASSVKPQAYVRMRTRLWTKVKAGV